MWLISILLGILPSLVTGAPIDSLINPHRKVDDGPVIVTGIYVEPTADGKLLFGVPSPDTNIKNRQCSTPTRDP